MRRREFIAVLGSATAWPLVAPAQQPAMPVVGLLDTSADVGEKLRVFYEGLKVEGYVSNENVTVEYHPANNDYSRLPGMATDLVSRKVAVIAALGAPAALAAKAATTTVPIVFAVGADPIRIGLVESLNRPGGNITGVTNMAAELEQKRLEVLHQLLPTANNLALLVNPNNPNAVAEKANASAAAAKLGVRVDVVEASGESDFDGVFAKLAELRTTALAISNDGLFIGNSPKLAAIALSRAMPAVFQFPEFAAAGGLMSYGSNLIEFYHQAGTYSALILKGAKAADLPVFQSTNIDLVINMKTAKALGITIPRTLLGRANQVIE
jgi:putative tryptophan/tyrosine transport system substrate-binding protein